MSKTRRTYLIAWIAILAVLLAGSILAPDGTGGESVQETMRDAVLHESNQINLLGSGPSTRGWSRGWW